MTNADKFKSVFGLYATELWSMSEKNFLKWLKSEVMNCSEIPNNSDTISRTMAIDAMAGALVDFPVGLTEAYEMAEDALSGLPSAQPERKTGKWIAYGDIPTECPFCHEDWDKYVYGDIWYHDETPNYCPNCGADMKGE